MIFRRIHLLARARWQRRLPRRESRRMTRRNFSPGVPVRGTPLEALSRDQCVGGSRDGIRQGVAAARRAPARENPRVGAGVSRRRPTRDRGPVFYFFSGPDILYAHAFYPRSLDLRAGRARTRRHAAGRASHLPPGALASGLANLRKSLNSVLSFSFFITKDMKVDLRQNQLSGTLPVLYVFLARAGCRIESVDLVWLDKTGAFATGKTATPGARIVFFGPERRAADALLFLHRSLERRHQEPAGLRQVLRSARPRAQPAEGRVLPHAPRFVHHGARFSPHAQHRDRAGRLRHPDQKLRSRALGACATSAATRDRSSSSSSTTQPDLAAIYAQEQPAAAAPSASATAGIRANPRS